MQEYVIQTEKFSRVYQDTIAVHALDLKVPRGSIFGLLGSNGAGKTTIIRALTGHLHPTSGTVSILGKNPWQLLESERQRISYVPDSIDLPGWMSASQAFQHYAAFYPTWNQEEHFTCWTNFRLIRRLPSAISPKDRNGCCCRSL
jgi:ABC-2 type transport system ATP-binding protein